MRRAMASVAAVGALLVLSAAAGAAGGAACPDRVSWHGTSYRSVTTHREIPLGRRLGKGTLTSTCRTTRTGGGYALAGGSSRADETVQRVVHAVDGLRPSVAVAIAGRRPALFVSRTPATGDEVRVLRRLRGL